MLVSKGSPGTTALKAPRNNCTWLASIFSYTRVCLFILEAKPFEELKFLILMKFNLPIFFSSVLSFGVGSKKKKKSLSLPCFLLAVHSFRLTLRFMTHCPWNCLCPYQKSVVCMHVDQFWISGLPILLHSSVHLSLCLTAVTLNLEIR
jgi:hypothetical protein